jgi:hypothetical protein
MTTFAGTGMLGYSGDGGPAPNTVLPFTKLTVPVGVPAPGASAATVAVSVGFEPFCARVRR